MIFRIRAVHLLLVVIDARKRPTRRTHGIREEHDRVVDIAADLGSSDRRPDDLIAVLPACRLMMTWSCRTNRGESTVFSRSYVTATAACPRARCSPRPHALLVDDLALVDALGRVLDHARRNRDRLAGGTRRSTPASRGPYTASGDEAVHQRLNRLLRAQRREQRQRVRVATR